MLLGALVLIGWILNSTPLTSVIPGLVPMNPVTAVGFILGGAALWSLESTTSRPSTRIVAKIVATAVLALGLIRVTGYVLGWDGIFDDLLFRERLAAVPYGPNRMAPNTALGFLLIGAALLLSDVESARGSRPAQYPALLVSLVALLTITGYAYQTTLLTRVSVHLPMALNTALGFLALSLGVLASRPARGFPALFASAGPGGATARGLLGPAVGIPLVLGWFGLQGERAGLYDTAVGMALFAITSAFLLSLVIWRMARSLDDVDVERGRIEDALRDRTTEIETANAELEAFSYSVSHDLRAPLRAIDGFARILVQDHTAQLDLEGQRLLGVVQGNARLMGKLIDDLLAFARLGRDTLRSQAVDMTALTQAVLAEVQLEHPDEHVAATLSALHPAHGDPAMLRQVLANLLRNAWKFTRGRAQPTVAVSSSPNGATITYRVEDNGAGFDMRHADKLFGVFQRLHRAEQFEGTGIGLALVQRIIARHGGRVWAEGKVDDGATFYFTLPAGAKDGERQPNPPS